MTIEEEKQTLLDWCQTFDVKPIETEGLSIDGVLLSNEIFSKFQKFIAWSKDKIENQ